MTPLPPFDPPSPARSRVMSAIRSQDTRPELRVRSALHRAGFRFRLRPKQLPGRPDLVLPRFRTAVFVHGCFWHAHSCRAGKIPKANGAYWSAKLARNVARDARNQADLESLGWHVAVIHECSLDQEVAALLDQLRRARRDELPHDQS